MAAKARTGCQQCRIKHLKCDQATPMCGRCEASGTECIRGFTYRFHREKFAGDQKWLATPNEITFVDESKGLASNSDYESYSEYATPPPEARSTDPSTLSPTTDLHPEAEHSQLFHFGHVTIPIAAQRRPSSAPLLSQSNPFEPPFGEQQVVRISSEPSHEDLPLISEPNPLSIEGILNKGGPEVAQIENRQPYNPNEGPHSIPPIYSETPVWPLTDPSEALLLRHFVQNLAIWLDLCDPKRHFQVDVPQRAGSCRILLNAIFALSARHLSRIGLYDSFASNRYHQECLKFLIPMLNDTATVSDESLFAATIILRVLEEMDAPEIEAQGHILGIQVFVGARDPYSMVGGLSEAAFWVGLRQEIYSAMMKNQPTQLNLEHCNVDRSLEATSDFGWANRAVVHCADVLNCCFGDSGVSTRHWVDLKLYSERWQEMKPLSFTPIYYREPDRRKREAFPEIWYFQACHIIGFQHYLLAEILLAIFNPKLPRIGGSRTAAVQSMESQVGASLRELCGIGLSNRWTPPGIFTASMGIAICGDRFTDRIDQEALLDVLVKTEKDHARPTAAVQQQMMKAWGWINDD